jgi:hypothetical protein
MEAKAEDTTAEGDQGAWKRRLRCGWGGACARCKTNSPAGGEPAGLWLW